MPGVSSPATAAADTQAMACADSSAGRIPSVRASSWKASSTSASSADTYRARPTVGQMGVLRPDAGVVEPGRDRGRLQDLSRFVLDERAAHPVEDPGDAAA